MNKRHIVYSMFIEMQNQTHKRFLSEDKSAAAVVSPGKPLWLYPGENLGDGAIRLFFYSCLAQLKKAPPGVIAPVGAAEICAEIMESVYGGEYNAKEIIAYYLEDRITGENAAREVDGELCPAVPNDSAFLAEWLEAFYSEVFDSAPSGTAEPFSAEAPPVKIKPELFIWRDGCPRAMGMLNRGGLSARLNLIYTPRQYRRRGYGTAVVMALAQKAAADGKTPMLYTAAANAAANTLYRKLGFKEAGRLTEISKIGDK